MKQHLYLDRMLYRRWLESGAGKNDNDSGDSEFPNADEDLPTISLEEMARRMGM